MKTTLQNYAVRFIVGVLASMCVLGTGKGTAQACSTPVYRYAMFNWSPAPYEVYYFNHGEPSKEDAEVIKYLSKYQESENDVVPNVMVAKIDPERKEITDRLAPWAKKAWEAHSKDPKPLFLMMTPWGAEFFAGRLDMATAKAMLDSPLRHKIAKLLDAGNAAVLLTVAPPDAEKKAKKAHKLVNKIVKQVAPKDKDKDKKSAADQNADDEEMPPVKIAKLTLSSKDPAEKWLIKMLMLGEKDLDKEAGEVMVFPVFGRGRALPPLVGEAITADNLMECVAYISGPCSCQIKDQNIGGDLLMTWNWDATAEQLAQNDPIGDDEEGDGFGPPPGAKLADPPADKPVEKSVDKSAAVKAADKPMATEKPVVAEKPAAVPAASIAENKPVDKPAPAVALAAESKAENSNAAPPCPCCVCGNSQQSCTMCRYLGHYAVGIGIAVALVLIGGLLVLRRS